MTNNDEQLNTVDEQLNQQADVQLDEQPLIEAEQDGEVEQASKIEQAGEVDKTGEAIAPTVAKKRSKAEIVINVALWVAVVILLIAVVLRLFVFNTVAVDGASMNPTYEHGNVVTVNKATAPKRGDVVVFYLKEVENKFLAQFAKPEECRENQPYEKLIKRVVATEGDKIWAQHVSTSGDDITYRVVVDTADGNRIYEDYYVKHGETLSAETYFIHTNALSALGILADCTEDNPYIVSKGCFFAMGDNRDNSKDSREHGEFKVSQLFGVVLDK